jgi:radical SAM protein (TIGR01212 family)
VTPGLPWLDAKTYYTRRWGEPLGRVGVDGGFSCPNRGPNRQAPGCTFCSEQGNRPPYQAGAADLEDQIRAGMEFQGSRYGVSRFSLYFQSFSSTWAPVETLRTIYDRALAAGSFAELTVGTRPDCVPEAVADLLASYQGPQREVWVELGLQSSRDETLDRIRRGHGVAAFREAASRLRDRGLRFTTHVMFGLPGEGKAEFLDTVALALAEGSSGLKFHDLILVPGTELYRQWEAGSVAPVNPEAFLEAAAEALVGLSPEVVLWRVQSDPEDRQSVPAPGDKWPKNRFLNRLAAEVRKRQGL